MLQSHCMDTNTGIELVQKSLEVKPAGAWSRFWASMIDGLILAIPIFLILSLIYFILPSLLVNFVNKNNPYGIIYIISPILGLFYSAYLTVNKGATWGKDAYGLKVVKYKTTDNISYGKSFLRDLIKSGFYFIPVFSGLIALVNGFIIVFSSEKRGIHDKIAGTQVIKFKNPWSMKKQLLILLPLLIFAFISVAFYSQATNTLASKNNLNKNNDNVGSMIPSLKSIGNREAQSNNTWRSSSVNAILNSVNQYMAENNGKIPSVITTSEQEISKSKVDLCSILVPTYIAALPSDSDMTSITDCGTTYATGYTIFKDSTTNKITVRAPYAELGQKIEATR